ncbi:MFS transporter phenyl propionate permease [Oceanimonas sp. GK1]|uniref:3-phenylpropionate MFS transporter n=1 Tax=Oceanimonas sp. (strain GK1 / IBRC-M 10197) TaxID=511062 RepID=UPI00024955D6|nr:3-phenylpropionate MFS transporter [Oceanimonas sp. GK1]AEY02509.1 MFS transporter phenyl propionate permease [Oceanimonas sp. GK1]
MAPAYWLSLFFALYYFGYGTFLPFWALWLGHAGASAGLIGLLLGLGMAVRCVGTLGVMSRVRAARHLLPVMQGLCLLSLLGFAAFYGWQSSLGLLVLTVLVNLFYPALIPLSEAMASRYIVQVHLDYGKTRLWGSAAFIAANLVVGLLSERLGNQWILHSLLMSLGLMLLLTLTRPHPLPAEQPASRAGEGMMQVLRRPGVGRCLLITALLQGSHAFYYGFSALYWQQQGYSTSVIGYLWGLGVLAEILVFAGDRKWLSHLGARALLLAGLICALCRWLMLGATTELAWLVLAQLLHAGSFGLSHLGAVRFISRELDAAAVFGAQALYASISLGMVSGLVLMLSGLLFAQLGGHTFWLMAALVLPVAWLLARPLGEEQRRT